VSRETIAKAQALLDVGRADEAAAMLSTALAADPGAWRAWCMLGFAHLECARHREALDCARRAIELDPEEGWPHRIASVAERHLGYKDRAVASAREAVRLGPHEAYAHAQLAVALAQARPSGPAEPLNEAARALQLGGHDAAIHRMAGDVALALKYLWLAEERYQRSLEIDPSNAAAINNLALIRLRRGLPIAAANGFSRAAALDPTADLHRRNLDVAVRHALVYAMVLLGGVALVDAALPVAEGAALATAFILAGVYVVKARRAIGPAAWAYAWRVPLRNAGGRWTAGAIAVQVCLLGAIPIVNRSTPSDLAGWPFMLGAFAVVSILKAQARR
jgi:tetratricopeptide (TPR) repeat protein